MTRPAVSEHYRTRCPFCRGTLVAYGQDVKRMRRIRGRVPLRAKHARTAVCPNCRRGMGGVA